MNIIRQGLEEFAAAREQFGHLVNELQSEQTLGMEHGDVEQMISREGNELLRRLLQGHLDLRAAREQKQEGVIGADGGDINTASLTAAVSAVMGLVAPCHEAWLAFSLEIDVHPQTSGKQNTAFKPNGRQFWNRQSRCLS
jgi:hypothetical protein